MAGFGCPPRLLNLHMAKKARLAALANTRLGTLMKLQENWLNELKAYCSGTEQLRVACWNLSMLCTAMQHSNEIQVFDTKRFPDGPPWLVGHPPHVRERILNNLRQERESFSTKYKAFFELWALVKGTIPEDTERIVGFLRHETKTPAQVVVSGLESLESSLEANEFDLDHINSRIVGLTDTLEPLLDKLNTIFSLVNEVRNSAVFDLLMAAEPNNAAAGEAKKLRS